MNDRLKKLLGERTLVLVKPDAVKRGLIGTIFQRFEQVGMKIVACKLLIPTREHLDGHFPKSTEWVQGMGKKTLETYAEYGIDPTEILGTNDALAIGNKIKEWNYYYLTLGPVVVMAIQGIHAVDTMRKLIGHTLPYKAMPGTIRGDFSINAPDLANVVGSACKNLVHASGTVEEAEQEISNWFNSNEILEYERTDEFLHFVQGQFTETTKEVHTMSHGTLKQTLNTIKEIDPRNAAEHAYALAMLSKHSGNNDQAVQFGNEAIALFDKCPMDTMENCASRNTIIEGIVIPDLIHQDVVRDRLQPLALR